MQNQFLPQDTNYMAPHFLLNNSHSLDVSSRDERAHQMSSSMIDDTSLELFERVRIDFAIT
jgi:hypothetical protein